MEFDEIKKIWNEQKGENMYVIDEQTMHSTVLKNKSNASSKMDMVEIGVGLINATVAVILFIDALDDPHKWDFLGSAMLMATVGYIIYFRWKRKMGEKQFDQSILGALDHAIMNVKHLIRFSYLMIVGYLVPFTIFNASKMLDRGASLEKWLLVFGLYALAFVLITWESRRFHQPKKRKLERLREKLVE